MIPRTRIHLLSTALVAALLLCVGGELRAQVVNPGQGTGGGGGGSTGAPPKDLVDLPDDNPDIRDQFKGGGGGGILPPNAVGPGSGGGGGGGGGGVQPTKPKPPGGGGGGGGSIIPPGGWGGGGGGGGTVDPDDTTDPDDPVDPTDPTDPTDPNDPTDPGDDDGTPPTTTGQVGHGAGEASGAERLLLGTSDLTQGVVLLVVDEHGRPLVSQPVAARGAVAGDRDRLWLVGMTDADGLLALSLPARVHDVLLVVDGVDVPARRGDVVAVVLPAIAPR